MTGWEFAKYLVDMMYSHWATTIVFLFFLHPLSDFNLVKIDKYEKTQVGGDE